MAFPELAIGPLTLRTFGLMVALGVRRGGVGRWPRGLRPTAGSPQDETYRLTTRMVHRRHDRGLA